MKNKIGIEPPATNVSGFIKYDLRSEETYASRWVLPMKPGEIAANDIRKAERGMLSIGAAPFRTGADAIFDHAKYFAVSHDSFPMPKNGSLQFSVDIKATTPVMQPVKLIEAASTDTPNDGRPYRQPAIKGQQAAMIFNMTNVETRQAFNWFVSGSFVFALIERLPGSVRPPGLTASDSTDGSLDSIHSQIIKSAPMKPGETHSLAIRYTRCAAASTVDYFLDGNLFAHVDHVGFPLDTHRGACTGVDHSLYSLPGGEHRRRMDTFAMGHGLYSMPEAFLFQHRDAPEQAVSIPIGERLFGQDAGGEFSRFEVMITPE